MKNLILLLLLTSCISYPPTTLWQSTDNINGEIYTETGLLDAKYCHVSFVVFNEHGGAYAVVDDGETVGQLPVIIQKNNGEFLTFSSPVALIKYFELNGWVFDGQLQYLYRGNVFFSFVFYR
jgi:hypothetical protein